MSRPITWVEISKKAFKQNLEQFKNVLSGTKIMLVVKSNAYGHGMLPMAKLAEKFGINWLGVVNLEEARKLREGGIKTPILVLSYYQLNKEEINFAIKNDIRLVVYSEEQLKILDNLSKREKQKLKVHLKIDTGLSRLGVLVDKADSFILKSVKKYKNLIFEGIFSHFAASEENLMFSQFQLDRFNELIKRLERKNVSFPLKHFACSAASLVLPTSRFNLVRLGIAAYGLWPSSKTKRIVLSKYPNFTLHPILSMYTKIVQLKGIPANSFVGYGCTYKTRKPTIIAVLPVGYWEGYDRGFSRKGKVIIKDKFCPVLGRVCMNMIIVDVSKVKNLKIGDRAIIIGKSESKKISVDDLAKMIGTINYEIVTRINPLIPRFYV